jgi:TetR/AcrR family transcriptional regulator
MTAQLKSISNIGAKKRSIILSSALKAFAENGYKGASIQKIADAAGLPKANVLYYFVSKRGLYSAVMQSILIRWNSSFDSVSVDDCPAIALACYIADKMEISRLHPYSSKAFAIEIINGANNVDLAFQDKHREWVNSRIAVINGWIDAGKMDYINPEYLLYHIWSSTQHYADFSSQITQLRGKAMNQEEFHEATCTITQIILKGCGLSVPDEYTLKSNTADASPTGNKHARQGTSS